MDGNTWQRLRRRVRALEAPYVHGMIGAERLVRAVARRVSHRGHANTLARRQEFFCRFSGSGVTTVSGSHRVMHGGSWYFDAGTCWSVVRDYAGPGSRPRLPGVRLLRTVQESLGRFPLVLFVGLTGFVGKSETGWGGGHKKGVKATICAGLLVRYTMR